MNKFITPFFCTVLLIASGQTSAAILSKSDAEQAVNTYFWPENTAALAKNAQEFVKEKNGHGRAERSYLNQYLLGFDSQLKNIANLSLNTKRQNKTAIIDNINNVLQKTEKVYKENYSTGLALIEKLTTDKTVLADKSQIVSSVDASQFGSLLENMREKRIKAAGLFGDKRIRFAYEILEQLLLAVRQIQKTSESIQQQHSQI
ncbi:MAG: hypothetical protein UU47_C0003G0046 [candidate division TM6 bacterium GW2011_GWE2_41_16]|nr:MAG: hypothetical protein UU47_C0003G0046 [candidate division TM6 bacterium GW2011_GWE2_41_16]